MSENLEMSVSIFNAFEIMDKIFTKGDTSVRMFLHSSPGIGKSSIVRQVATKQGLELVDLRLSTIEATDLCGIPFVSDGQQKFSIPDWFPTDKNSKGVIFLDELSNSSIDKQQAAYRLVLDREIQNKRKLPDGWFVIAAGNLKTDQTGAKGIVPALANRFSFHLTIRPSLEDFTQYAIANKLNQKIVGFLNFQPSVLYRAPSQNSIGFPTPRSWEQVSKLLDYNFSNKDLLTVISGCVGHGATIEFMSYLEYYDSLPDFKKILETGENYTVPKDNLGLMFTVTTNLMYLFMENYKEINKIKNLRHIFDQLSDECLIFVYKTIAQTKNVDMIMNIIEATNNSYKRIEKYVK